MMKALAITYKGIEDITQLEINEILSIPSQKKEGCVIFEVHNDKELINFTYLARSIRRALILLRMFKATNIEEVEKLVRENDFHKYTKEKTFAVRCINESKLDIGSKEIESTIGEHIDGKVNLNNPEVLFLVYIEGDNFYIGIDQVKLDLSKRDYKIFCLPNSIKGNIGYSLLRIADYKPKDTLIDPFCLDGIIPIEAGLFAKNKSINYFRKDKFESEVLDKEIKNKPNITALDKNFNSISAAKKNAKIAGINKELNFSKLDIEWLDPKFENESIDKIVTQIPKMSKYTNPKDIKKLYQEFFYQSEFILKKKGMICIMINRTEELIEASEKHNFKVVHEREIIHGKATEKVVVFAKNT